MVANGPMCSVVDCAFHPCHHLGEPVAVKVLGCLDSLAADQEADYVDIYGRLGPDDDPVDWAMCSRVDETGMIQFGGLNFCGPCSRNTTCGGCAKCSEFIAAEAAGQLRLWEVCGA